MKCYRLIFKKEDGRAMFSEIIEQEFPDSELNDLSWDRPILRHEIAGHSHFIALDRDYLESMLLGIGVFQSLSG